MVLKKSSIFGRLAWKWIAPTGKVFYFTRAESKIGKWVWYNSPDDFSSSQYFNSLEEMKEFVATAFSDEEE